MENTPEWRVHLMNVKRPHSFDVDVRKAVEIQRTLAGEVFRADDFLPVRTICGTDVSYQGEWGYAAVVVMSYPQLEILDTAMTAGKADFPYIPGLLSFREIPVLIPAFERLSVEPDLILVDGQGISHPRRFGIASHLGLMLDKPTLGCAKSKLCGQAPELPDRIGACESIRETGEIIGAVCRTREGVKPVYVSIGHRISLQSALSYVLACSKGFRMPEPLRVAHHIAATCRR